jgi:hypothetical protein
MTNKQAQSSLNCSFHCSQFASLVVIVINNVNKIIVDKWRQWRACTSKVAPNSLHFFNEFHSVV